MPSTSRTVRGCAMNLIFAASCGCGSSILRNPATSSSFLSSSAFRKTSRTSADYDRRGTRDKTVPNSRGLLDGSAAFSPLNIEVFADAVLLYRRVLSSMFYRPSSILHPRPFFPHSPLPTPRAGEGPGVRGRLALLPNSPVAESVGWLGQVREPVHKSASRDSNVLDRDGQPGRCPSCTEPGASTDLH